MTDLFDYNSSPFNPLLKVIIPALFFVALIIYVHISSFYEEKIRSFINTLLLFTFFVTVSGVFRFFGHGTMFGLSDVYSLKWLQSLALLVGAGFFALAGYKLKNLFGEKS